MPRPRRSTSLAEPFSLCLFTDLPRPGLAKRSLTPPLTPDEAADLQLAFVDDLLRATRALAGVRRLLCVYGEPRDERLVALATREGIDLVAQDGSDPGVRKANALARELEQGKRAAAILPVDAPTLPVSLIAEAFERLDAGCENVVGPTGSGGYWLVGVSRLVRPELLRNIGWGGRRVLADLVTRLATLPTPSALLPFWYDVCAPDDLSLLRAHLGLIAREREDPAPATRAVLARLGRAAWT